MSPPRLTLTNRQLTLLLMVCALLLALSAWQAYEMGTWVMETAPVFIVLPLLWATHDRFPLTRLLYALIAVHACVLMLGGHYTYARVPLGEWAREAFGLARNHYDRVGHFMQGAVPALVARELLLRHTGLQRGGWLFTVATCVSLAVSAVYELIEWGAAVALGAGADEFLATQGDVWDTQKDMLMAGIGAVVLQILLSRAHDRQLPSPAPLAADESITNPVPTTGR